MVAKFNQIDFETWERSEYVYYYINKIKCKYTLTAQLDITPIIILKEQKSLKFFPTFLYAIMRAVNENKEFRMAYNQDKQLGYWNFVVPAYTLFHEDDKTFSDVWSDYNEDFNTFYSNVVNDLNTYKDVKGIKAKPNQPKNFCSVSSIPWLSFSSFAQDTYEESDFLFPLIRFGKYYKKDDRFFIPFAVFVNHAVADGYHTSKLINDVQKFIDKAQQWGK